MCAWACISFGNQQTTLSSLLRPFRQLALEMGKQRMVPRPCHHRARPHFFAKRTLFHCHVRQQEQQQQIENDTELVYGRQISKLRGRVRGRDAKYPNVLRIRRVGSPIATNFNYHIISLIRDSIRAPKWKEMERRQTHTPLFAKFASFPIVQVCVRVCSQLLIALIINIREGIAGARRAGNRLSCR